MDLLTAKRLVGGVVCCGFEGLEYNEQIDNLIKNYYVSNFILFSRNYDNPEQLRKLSLDIHKKVKEYLGLTAIISIDQEGGSVTRLMTGVTFPSSPMTCSVTNYPDAARLTGKCIGRDMIMLGLNLDLAPCLDINHHDPYYSSIRMYGFDKEHVTKYSGEFIEGLHEYGVLACGKHFPGCGNNIVDTHFGQSILDEDEEFLFNNELYPFMNVKNLDSVMTTHTIYSGVDNHFPATLSKKIIKDILRNKMNYKGLVISDALEMDAIADFYGAVGAAPISLNAGVDMLLCCHDSNIQIKTLKYLTECMMNGTLNEEEMIDKNNRINEAKNRTLPYLEKYFYIDKPYEIDEESVRIQQEIIDNSPILIKGKFPIIDKETLILCPYAFTTNPAEDVFSERDLPGKIEKEIGNKVIVLKENKECLEEVKNLIDNYQKVVMFSYNISFCPIQKQIINSVLKSKESYLISLKGIMDINCYEKLDNYCCICEYTPGSVNTAIKLLKGEIKPLGSLK